MNKNLHVAKQNKNDEQIKPGVTFSDWTVLYYSGRHKNGRKTWKCECVCGTERDVIENNLKNNTSKSCGCRGVSKLIRRNKKLRSNAMDIKLAMTKSVISGYKKDAKNRNYIWDLSLEKCIELFNSNCFYCGSEPTNTRTTIGRKKDIFFKYTGIDRVDNTKGYTNSNVVPCCKKCNRAKDTMVLGDFLNHISKIYRNFNKDY